ncbi:MAG: DUF4389 domain-containing protein [Bacteroidetes bacterium]|nr:MAG: DUF4389 domain-containing protein [Bacteroidota bacterium]
MIKITIQHQEIYSRGELLLRTFFGGLYILLPHLFLMMFCQIWAGILSFIAWWVVLFTGKYPQSFFEYQVKMIRWSVRLNARNMNLSDGYPSFFPSGTDDKTSFDMPYPESLSRGLLLVRAFFGVFYILLPHGFMLIFRGIAAAFLRFLAWWTILFTGKYPQSWFDFQVGTLRWSIRVNAYYTFLTDTYPPFSGKE